MGEKLYQSKRKYCKISYQKRLRLIDLVENQKMGVTRASKKLRIKIPTAKVILSTFRRKGQVFKKKAEECRPQPHKRSSPQPETPKIEAESESQEQVLEEEKKVEWGGWIADASISGDHQFLTRADYSPIFILDVIPYCCLPAQIINIF